MFSKNSVLKNFAKFTGKHLRQRSLFFWHRCFLVNFTKLLKIRFLQNTSERLLLSMLRVEILKICVPRSFLGGQDSGLSGRYSRLFYSFPWILGTSYFWKSCHDCFVAFFCNTLLVGCWSALIPYFSFSFLVSLKI